MNKGLIIGKFVPMHNGHKFAIMQAATLCSELTVLLCIDHLHDPKFPSPKQREDILRKELGDFSNIKVVTIDCTAFPYAKEDDLNVSIYWANELYKLFPDTGTIFGSEHYIKMMADNWGNCNGVRYQTIDINRKQIPISATMIRNDPMRYFDYLVNSAKPIYTKHVLVIGAESCGKSTLVSNLGDVLGFPTVPEMYRSMFPEKGMDFNPTDLVRVAELQNKAVLNQVYSPMNSGMIIHDTCNDVTLQYLTEYYPNDWITNSAVVKIRDTSECKFDLILFCDIDVPWEQDGTRTIGGDLERKTMRDKFYSLAVCKANSNNCPIVILQPDYKRIPDALNAIKGIM